MTCTGRTGAATGAGAKAYAVYVTNVVKYYVGEIDGPEPLVELRPDLSPAFAERLGIDLSRDLTLPEIANLMNNRRADGEEIEGKKKHSPHQSVASVFGLDPEKLPTVAEIENVLAGKRADGSVPRGEAPDVPEITSVAATIEHPSADPAGVVVSARDIDLDQQRQELNLAHLEAWFEGRPDLQRLAECVVSPDAEYDPSDFQEWLVSEIDVAIAAAERTARGDPGLSDEARGLHGLPEPEAVAEHLCDIPLAELRARRDHVADHWDEAWLKADYEADILASGWDEAPTVADILAQQPDPVWLASFDDAPPHGVGDAPGAPKGPPPLSEKRIESALRKFKDAIGVPVGRDATAEEIQRVADGRLDQHGYFRDIKATSPAVGYEDLTFSADKSVSSVFAVGSDAERAVILDAMDGAVADAMAYAETVLGVARRGAGGRGESQEAELAFYGVTHTTSRPAVDIVRQDAQGRDYTDTRQVPTESADPQLHQHKILLSSLMTKDGHIGSVDLSKLKGEIKTFGAVFHAGMATRLRRHGVDVRLGPHGEARIAGMDHLRKFHSRRTVQGEDEARRWAAAEGVDWDTLKPDAKAKLIDVGMATSRKAKFKAGDNRTTEDPSVNIPIWQAEAKAAGFTHRSVLNRVKPPLGVTHERRIEIARATSELLISQAFEKGAVITEGQMREMSARGLIVSGMGSDASGDIAAIVAAHQRQGITIKGEKTDLIQAIDIGEDGRKRTIYTTERAVEMEESLVAMVKAAAGDRSLALVPGQIDAAADRFLAKNAHIDPTGAHWIAQRKMAHDIGEGGRVSLSIGVGGSGKTKAVLAVLIDAWHEQGRTVIGMTVPWKASGEIKEAGADQTMAIDAFLHRVAEGKITVGRNTVIVADEVSLVSVRQQLALTKMVSETGAQLVEIGDPRQCASVETPAIDLLARTIGDEHIPKLLSSIRQKDEQDRAIALKFRSGDAADGIAALDGLKRFHLIAGGTDATVAHTVRLWRSITDENRADPDHSLLVMTPTNSQARQVGIAIRANMREAGEIGARDTVLKAKDKNSGETYDLPVTAGDKLRMFTRTYDADTPGRQKFLSSNGDIVQVREILPDGLRIRNEAGVEGRVTWAQMKAWRAPKSSPILATYGYALTPDTSQSLTRGAAIWLLPEGSRQTNGNKNYVAQSRHRGEVHMVVSETHDRKDIVRRQMLGAYQAPSHEDVVRNIANNLNRFSVKAYATDVLRRSTSVKHRPRMGSVEPSPMGNQPSRYETMRMAPVIKHVMGLAQEVVRKVQRPETPRHTQSRGPRMSL